MWQIQSNNIDVIVVVVVFKKRGWLKGAIITDKGLISRIYISYISIKYSSALEEEARRQDRKA